MQTEDIKRINESQEIGAHTINHPKLAYKSYEEQRSEIIDGKKYLENILSKEILMFAYPNGSYNSKTIDLVKEAGYIGARGVLRRSFDLGDVFEMEISLHVYPFPFLKKTKEYSFSFWLKSILKPLKERRTEILKYGLSINSYFSWYNFSRNMFNKFCEQGGIFHIFGHSWEIEKFRMWDNLEKFLKYISNKSDIKYVTNGELIKLKLINKI